MKKLPILAVAALTLSNCGYQKDGASWTQTYDDYMGCSKEAQKQERTLEKQCMVKLGYQAQ